MDKYRIVFNHLKKNAAPEAADFAEELKRRRTPEGASLSGFVSPEFKKVEEMCADLAKSVAFREAFTPKQAQDLVKGLNAISSFVATISDPSSKKSAMHLLGKLELDQFGPAAQSAQDALEKVEQLKANWAQHFLSK
jgi:hypothetical protein